MKRNTELVSAMYGKGGILEAYRLLDEKGVESSVRRLYDLLKTNQLFPHDLNQFVFLSPSSNTGVREIALATMLDQAIEQGEFQGHPKFIASDFFGHTTESGNFVPGFDPNLKPNLEHVDFNFLSGRASELPLADNSVNMIYDRLGALWYSVNDFFPTENDGSKSWQKEWEEDEEQENRLAAQEAVKKLLAKYAQKLKLGGAIVMDGAENNSPPSTGEYLEWAFGDQLSSELDDFVVAETIKRKTASGKEKLRMHASVSMGIESLGKGADRIYVATLRDFSQKIEPILASQKNKRF